MAVNNNASAQKLSHTSSGGAGDGISHNNYNLVRLVHSSVADSRGTGGVVLTSDSPYAVWTYTLANLAYEEHNNWDTDEVIVTPDWFEQGNSYYTYTANEAIYNFETFTLNHGIYHFKGTILTTNTNWTDPLNGKRPNLKVWYEGADPYYIGTDSDLSNTEDYWTRVQDFQFVKEHTVNSIPIREWTIDYIYSFTPSVAQKAHLRVCGDWEASQMTGTGFAVANDGFPRVSYRNGNADSNSNNNQFYTSFEIRQLSAKPDIQFDYYDI